MMFVRLTLADDSRQVLIRADLIQQIRQRPPSANAPTSPQGTDVWLPTGAVTVSESIDEIQAKLTGL